MDPIICFSPWRSRRHATSPVSMRALARVAERIKVTIGQPDRLLAQRSKAMLPIPGTGIG